MRRLGRIAARLAVVILGLLAALVIILESDWSRDRARRYAVQQAARFVNGTLSIGRVRGNWWSGVELDDVRIAQDADVVFSARTIVVQYRPFELFRDGATRIRSLRLSGVALHLVHEPGRPWNVTTLLKPRKTQGGTPRRIDIDQILLEDGSASVSGNRSALAFEIPGQIAGAHLAAAFHSGPGGRRLDVQEFAAAATSPAFAIRRYSGSIEWLADRVMLRDVNLATDNTQLQVEGTIVTVPPPARFELTARAAQFDFQEIGRILPGIRAIAVTSAFTARLSGPRTAMNLDLRLTSDAGDAAGRVLVDFVRPGWHAAGGLDLRVVNAAKWLGKPDKVTEITGRANFDLDLGIGRHLPLGPFTFAGPKARFVGYEASAIVARGTMITERVNLQAVRGVAYGAPFTTQGYIDLKDPYSFRLSGDVTNIDLTGLPKSIPVPHVPSALTFAYHADGRFTRPMLIADADFERSVFIGATVEEGTHGTVDTSGALVAYSGSGSIAGVDLRRFGQYLEVPTLTQERFDGTIAGAFDVTGTGTAAAVMSLQATGRLRDSSVFGARIRDAAVALRIEETNVNGRFDGAFDGLNLAIPLLEPRYKSLLRGTAQLSFGVKRWLVEDWTLGAMTADGSVALNNSSWRDIALDRADVTGEVRDGFLTARSAHVVSQGVDLTAAGRLALIAGDNDLTFSAHVADGAVLPAPLTEVRGKVDIDGRVTGDATRPHVEGGVKTPALSLGSVTAVDGSATYRVDLPDWQVASAAGSAQARFARITAAGADLENVDGTADYANSEVKMAVRGRYKAADASLSGTVLLHPEHSELHLQNAAVSIAGTDWRLAPLTAGDAVQWSAGLVKLPPLRLTNAGGDQTIELGGTVGWGGAQGRLEVNIPGLDVGTVDAVLGRASTYTGLLSGRATITGDIGAPEVNGTFDVAAGKAGRFPFEHLAASLRYTQDTLSGKARLDQAPGVWLEASGSVPRTFGRAGDTREVDLTVKSSPVDLAVTEAFTTRIANPHGVLLVDLGIKGTAEDPRITGKLTVTNGSFLVPLTGVLYAGGDVDISFEPDLVTVNRFHLEDDKKDPLDVTGRIGTHERRIRELALDVSASKFELLANEFGDVDVDALVQVQGAVDAPTVTGDVVLSHAQVDLNPILERTMRRPYSLTGAPQPAPDTAPEAEPLPPLWQRLALALRVSIPDNLSLRGDELAAAAGGIGIGDIRAMAGGDLSFRKVASGPLQIIGPIRLIRGTYAFQGRRFTLAQDGQILFTGGPVIDPDLTLTATRTISGIETRVGITGRWSDPQLQLTSNPPLDETDILSLIVFNQSSNELASSQRAEIGVRAAALASGFVTTPLLNSVGRMLGLESLTIEPFADATGASRITASRQIGSRVLFTFQKQLGSNGYNQGLIEAQILRAWHVQASIADSRSFVARQSLFQRVERAGIDLIFSFSY
jgi:autotransporter translocation and assembly factor TamB